MGINEILQRERGTGKEKSAAATFEKRAEEKHSPQKPGEKTIQEVVSRPESVSDKMKWLIMSMALHRRAEPGSQKTSKGKVKCQVTYWRSYWYLFLWYIFHMQNPRFWLGSFHRICDLGREQELRQTQQERQEYSFKHIIYKAKV